MVTPKKSSKKTNKVAVKKVVGKTVAKKVPTKKVVGKTVAKKVIEKTPTKKVIEKTSAKKVVGKTPTKKVTPKKVPPKKVPGKSSKVLAGTVDKILPTSKTPIRHKRQIEEGPLTDAAISLGLTVPSKIHKTSPFMTQYEFAAVIHARALKLSAGEHPLVPLTCFNTLTLARQEIEERLAPLVIERRLPNGIVDRWDIREMFLPLM